MIVAGYNETDPAFPVEGPARRFMRLAVSWDGLGASMVRDGQSQAREHRLNSGPGE